MGQTSSGETALQSDREGLNMVLMIQVPLKQTEPMRFLPMAAALVERHGHFLLLSV